MGTANYTALTEEPLYHSQHVTVVNSWEESLAAKREGE